MRTSRGGTRIVLAGMALLISVANACSSDSDGSTLSTSVASTSTSTTTTIVDPEELPDVDPAGARLDLDYLDGDGVALVRMVQATRAFAESNDDATTPSAATCAALLADLDDAGAPGELADLIRPVQDEVLRTSLDSVRSAAVHAVSACEQTPGEQQPPTPAPGPDSGAVDPVSRADTATALFLQRYAQMEAAS